MRTTCPECKLDLSEVDEHDEGCSAGAIEAILEELEECRDQRNELENQLATTRQEQSSVEYRLRESEWEREDLEYRLREAERERDNAFGQVADLESQLYSARRDAEWSRWH